MKYDFRERKDMERMKKKIIYFGWKKIEKRKRKWRE